MKIQLAILFIAVLVAIPCLADVDAPDNDAKPPTNGVAKQDSEVLLSLTLDAKPPKKTQINGVTKQDSQEDEESDESSLPKELEDDDQQVKKRRIQLSAGSCRILKRYGYCRHRGIRRHCLRQCARYRVYYRYMCGPGNRYFLRSRVTRRYCQYLCTIRSSCRAVEWWGRYNFNCYMCRNHHRMRLYLNTRDLAWPPYVSVKY